MLLDRFGDVGLRAAERIMGVNYSWQPDNEAHGRYWTTSYPLRAMVPMIRLVRQVRGLDLSEVTVPLQVIYSPDDQVVDAAWIEKFYARWQGEPRELSVFRESDNPSQHVLAGDVQAPEATVPVADLISAFIQILAA
jgi:esterase/lipase